MEGSKENTREEILMKEARRQTQLLTEDNTFLDITNQQQKEQKDKLKTKERGKTQEKEREQKDNSNAKITEKEIEDISEIEKGLQLYETLNNDVLSMENNLKTQRLNIIQDAKQFEDINKGLLISIENKFEKNKLLQFMKIKLQQLNMDDSEARKAKIEKLKKELQEAEIQKELYKKGFQKSNEYKATQTEEAKSKGQRHFKLFELKQKKLHLENATQCIKQINNLKQALQQEIKDQAEQESSKNLSKEDQMRLKEINDEILLPPNLSEFKDIIGLNEHIAMAKLIDKEIEDLSTQYNYSSEEDKTDNSETDKKWETAITQQENAYVKEVLFTECMLALTKKIFEMRKELVENGAELLLPSVQGLESWIDESNNITQASTTTFETPKSTETQQIRGDNIGDTGDQKNRTTKNCDKSSKDDNSEPQEKKNQQEAQKDSDDAQNDNDTPNITITRQEKVHPSDNQSKNKEKEIKATIQDSYNYDIQSYKHLNTCYKMLDLLNDIEWQKIVMGKIHSTGIIYPDAFENERVEEEQGSCDNQRAVLDYNLICEKLNYIIDRINIYNFHKNLQLDNKSIQGTKLDILIPSDITKHYIKAMENMEDIKNLTEQITPFPETEQLSEKWTNSTPEFKEFLIHNYIEENNKKWMSICNEHLSHLELFSRELLNYLERPSVVELLDKIQNRKPEGLSKETLERIDNYVRAYHRYEKCTENLKAFDVGTVRWRNRVAELRTADLNFVENVVLLSRELMFGVERNYRSFIYKNVTEEKEMNTNKNSNQKENNITPTNLNRNEHVPTTSNIDKHLQDVFAYPNEVKEHLDNCIIYFMSVQNIKGTRVQMAYVKEACNKYNTLLNKDFEKNQMEFLEKTLKQDISDNKEYEEIYQFSRKELTLHHMNHLPDDNCKSAAFLKQILPPEILRTYRDTMKNVQKLAQHGDPGDFNVFDREECGWYGQPPKQQKVIERHFCANKPNLINEMWKEHHTNLKLFIHQLTDFVLHDLDEITKFPNETFEHFQRLTPTYVDKYRVLSNNYKTAQNELDVYKINNDSTEEIKNLERTAYDNFKNLTICRLECTYYFIEEVERNYRAIVHGTITVPPPNLQSDPNTDPQLANTNSAINSKNIHSKETHYATTKETTNLDTHSISDDSPECENTVEPTERNVAVGKAKHFYKKLAEFDISRALPIIPKNLHEPSPGDWFVFQGTLNSNDLFNVDNNDSYAWKNKGNVPSQTSDNFHNTLKTRTNIENTNETSDKWIKKVYYLGEKDLYGVLYIGDNNGVLRKKQLKQYGIEQKRKEKKKQLLHTNEKRKSNEIPTYTIENTNLPRVISRNTLAENYAAIMESSGVINEPKKTTQLEPAIPLHRTDAFKTLTDDQLAMMFLASKLAYQTGELDCAKGKFITLGRGGEAYSMHTYNYEKDKELHSKQKWIKEIKCDGYRWGKERTWYKTYQATNGELFHAIVKSFKAFTGTGFHDTFMKYLYIDTLNHTMIIHYTGDESVAPMQPHGNTIVDPNCPIPPKIYHPTNPRVTEEYKKAFKNAKTKLSPSAVAADLSKPIPGEGPSREIHAPRNARQAIYRQDLELEPKDLKDKEEERKCERVYDYFKGKRTHFVRELQTRPHIYAILMTEIAVTEFYRSVSNLPPGKKVQLHYDTTFDISKQCYASLLCYRSETLRGRRVHEGTQNTSLIVPLVVFLHEKRDEVSHEQLFLHVDLFMDKCAPKTPGTVKFTEIPKVLITDREFDTLRLLNTEKVFCWNHLRQNIKHKVSSTDNCVEVQADARELQNDFEQLLRSNTLNTYQARRDQFLGSQRWLRNPRFAQYFMTHMNASIENHSGKWNLERLELPFHPQNGITNNPSETFNSYLKIFQGDEKFKVHKAIMFFKSVLDWYDANTEAAYHNLGQYRLKDEHYAREKPRGTYRGERLKTTEQLMEELVATFQRATPQPEETEVDEAQEISTDSEDDPVSCEAKWINAQPQRPIFINETGSFQVRGRDGSRQLVELQPNKYCTCMAHSLCPHVLACMVITRERPNYTLLPGDKLKKRPTLKARRKRHPGGKVPMRGEHDHDGVKIPRKTGMKYQKHVPKSSSDVDSNDSTNSSIHGKRKSAKSSKEKPSKRARANLSPIPETDEVDHHTIGQSPGGASYHSSVSDLNDSFERRMRDLEDYLRQSHEQKEKLAGSKADTPNIGDTIGDTGDKTDNIGDTIGDNIGDTGDKTDNIGDTIGDTGDKTDNPKKDCDKNDNDNKSVPEGRKETNEAQKNSDKGSKDDHTTKESGSKNKDAPKDQATTTKEDNTKKKVAMKPMRHKRTQIKSLKITRLHLQI